MKITATVLVIALALGIALLFFTYLGIYDVSATKPHTRLVGWILSTTMDNSVRRRAAKITTPPLSDPELARRGAGLYQAYCATCHGAPGVAHSRFAEGLNPPPPGLVKAVNDWTAAELFWLIRQGVKMSGMPAFAPSLSEDQTWALVAFLQRLPLLSPQEYQILVASAGARIQ